MNDTLLDGIASPPSWSIAIGSAGRGLILLSAALFALSALLWIFADRRARFAALSFSAACASLLGAFGCLGLLFATNRFEFEYVYKHADTKNALAYRIAGIWSGQEGSFLLWATCAAVFALLTARLTAKYRRWYSVAYAVFLGSLAGIMAFESPFRLNLTDEGRPFVPPEGVGLAPSLQNYWVIIHPPTIFLGFGSLTVLFALAFAAMMERDYDGWIPIVRPWGIVSTSLVGLGLCMGGFWAYETLGWGGFWMWDPVENVSFVPWCFAAAFIHGVIVQAVRGKWRVANLIFGGLPFLVFVYGTFLTRSGFLSDASVHSFAEMNRSALKLLVGMMAVTTLGFVGLWVVRYGQERADEPAPEKPSPWRREGFYALGVMTLCMMGVATAIGMSVPLISALKGEKPKVVEEALYHQVMPWIFVPLMLLMAVTPFVSWRGSKPKDLLSKIYSVFCFTVGVTGLLLTLCVATPFGRSLELAPTVTMLGKFKVNGLAWITTLVAVCVFVLVGNVWRVIDTIKRGKLGVAAFVAHLGVAILMVGLIVSRGFEKTARGVVMTDHPGRLLGYEVRYRGMTSSETDRDNRLKLDFYRQGGSKPIFTATPGLYKVKMGDGPETTMVWPHIQRGLLMDTYVSLGQPQTAAGTDFSLKPGASQRFSGMEVTYEKMSMKGEPGAAGTQFGAVVKVTDGKVTRTLNPTMELGGEGGPIQHPATLDKTLQLALVGMNASDKSVTLRLQISDPVYPIEVFHKPLTILVWLGTGVLAASGFVAAFYRRTRRVVEPEEEPAVGDDSSTREFVPALQGQTS